MLYGSWAVNAGAVEIQPWYSRVTPDAAAAATQTFTGSDVNLDRSVLNVPDFVVFDLDPPGGARTEEAFQAAVEVARLLRDALGDVQLDAFPKTSGKSGIHVYVPIRRQYSFEEARAFAHSIAKEVASLHPAHLTTVLAPEKRGGRVFLDVNQNARGKSVVAPYSARPTPEATVSTPVTWDELDYGADPRAFTIATLPERLREHGHLWKDMLRRRQVLPEDPN